MVILGPTAAGKSQLALALAERLGGEIVSADAMQVYEGMDIGTDKPTWEERRRVAHHLIDVSPPDVRFNVVHFQRLATDVIARIRARGHRPLVVGGSGLYLRALLEGYEFPGGPPSPKRASIEAGIRGDPAFRARLLEKSPRARSIPPRDVVRQVRAYESLGRSERAGAGERLEVSCVIGLTRPRRELYARIDERARRQVERGIFEEVRRLWDQGYRGGALDGLVYREAAWHLEGRITREEYVRLVARNTRRLAKRQLTWFRRERDVTWLDAGDAALVERALALVAAGDERGASNP